MPGNGTSGNGSSNGSGTSRPTYSAHATVLVSPSNKTPTVVVSSPGTAYTSSSTFGPGAKYGD